MTTQSQTEALKLAIKAMKSFQEGTGGLYEGEFDEEIKTCEEALAQLEQRWTPERIAGIARLKEAQDKKLAQPKQELDYKAIGQQAYESGYSTGYMDCAVKMKAQPAVTESHKQEPWLLETTQTLAKHMAREFYPEVTQWQCLDNLAGVISQIDNMTTGLMRKSEQEPIAKVCHDIEQHIGWNPNVNVAELPEGMELYGSSQPKESEKKPVTWLDDYNACKCPDNEARCFSDKVFRMMQKHITPPPFKELEHGPTKLWCETCEGTGQVHQEYQKGCHVGGDFECPDCDGKGYIVSRLHSITPPQRTWVKLTDEDFKNDRYA